MKCLINKEISNIFCERTDVRLVDPLLDAAFESSSVSCAKVFEYKMQWLLKCRLAAIAASETACGCACRSVSVRNGCTHVPLAYSLNGHNVDRHIFVIISFRNESVCAFHSPSLLDPTMKRSQHL